MFAIPSWPGLSGPSPPARAATGGPDKLDHDEVATVAAISAPMRHLPSAQGHEDRISRAEWKSAGRDTGWREAVSWRTAWSAFKRFICGLMLAFDIVLFLGST